MSIVKSAASVAPGKFGSAHAVFGGYESWGLAE